MPDTENVFPLAVWTLVSAPIWLPVLGCWLSMSAAVRIRWFCGWLAIIAFAFASANSSDRNSWQWPAAFIGMGFVAVYFGAVLLTWLVALRGAIRRYWTRKSTAD